MHDQNNNSYDFKHFRKQLSKAFKAPGSVPPELDRKILDAATAHFARQRRRGTFWRWTARAACAAVILFVIGLYTANLVTGFRSAAMPVVSSTARAGNRVTILDALALAKNIQAGRAGSDMDMNHDGVLDQKDVDMIAMAAVKLSPER
jgi:hypothetical protein